WSAPRLTNRHSVEVHLAAGWSAAVVVVVPEPLPLVAVAASAEVKAVDPESANSVVGSDLSLNGETILPSAAPLSLSVGPSPVALRNHVVFLDSHAKLGKSAALTVPSGLSRLRSGNSSKKIITTGGWATAETASPCLGIVLTVEPASVASVVLGPPPTALRTMAPDGEVTTKSSAKTIGAGEAYRR